LGWQPNRGGDRPGRFDPWGNARVRTARRGGGAGLRHAAAWLAIAAVLIAGYAHRDELGAVGRRTLAALVPSLAVELTPGQLLVAQSDDGHFRVAGTVDGVRTSFLLDTGASVVALRYETAAAAGLAPPADSFTVLIETANGPVLAAPVRIGRLTVAGIELGPTRALISAPGRLHADLLGMSVLSRLRAVEIHGSQLIVRP
jgi:aspartyl protease family protein